MVVPSMVAVIVVTSRRPPLFGGMLVSAKVTGSVAHGPISTGSVGSTSVWPHVCVLAQLKSKVSV